MGDHYMLGKRKQEAMEGGPLHARKQEAMEGGPLHARKQEAMEGGPLHARKQEAMEGGPLHARKKETGGYWTIQQSRFARVNALCNLLRERSQRTSWPISE